MSQTLRNVSKWRQLTSIKFYSKLPDRKFSIWFDGMYFHQNGHKYYPLEYVGIRLSRLGGFDYDVREWVML